MESSNESQLPRLYTSKEVAAWLQITPKTLRGYVKAGMFVNVVVVPHAERNRTLFTQASLDTFKTKYGVHLTTPERPRRAYNRRVVKGKRRKK